MDDLSNEQRAAVRDLVHREVRHSRGGGGIGGALGVILLFMLIGFAGYVVWRADFFDPERGGGGGDASQLTTLVVESMLDLINDVNGEIRHLAGSVARLRADFDGLQEDAEDVDRTYRALERRADNLEEMSVIADQMNLRLNDQTAALLQNEAFLDAVAARVGTPNLQGGQFECGHTYRPTGDEWETVLTRTVEFDQPFAAAPTMFLSVTKAEVYSRETNNVFSVETDNVTTETFDIVIRSAFSSSFSDCRIDWIALGQ